jgi:hypothetical protein
MRKSISQICAKTSIAVVLFMLLTYPRTRGAEVQKMERATDVFENTNDHYHQDRMAALVVLSSSACSVVQVSRVQVGE